MFGIFSKSSSQTNRFTSSKLPQTNSHSSNLSNPINLSILTQFYPPDYAATGQFIQELAAHLKQHNFNIHIFTGQPGYAFQSNSAPPIEYSESLFIKRTRASRIWPKRIRGRALNGLMFCLRSGLHLLKACWRGDILLLTTEPPYLPLLGLLTNLFFGVSYVCLLYDLYPDAAVELKVVSSNHWLVKFWDFINCWIWKQAQAIIVLSPTMKARLVAKCPEIEHKISVIHSWADPNYIKPLEKQKNWFAHQHNLVDKFTVLYSGNMGRCHDMETIIEAAEILKNDPIQFVFIGAGAKQKFCLEKAVNKQLNNCLFLPYQDKSVIPYSITAADLSLVSISPGLEGIIAPSKLYGILASGRPVAAICEKHSYLRALFAEANCGAAFNNGDAQSLAEFIRFLAADSQLSQHLGKAGRQYLCQHFTPQNIAHQYAQVLTPKNQENQSPNHKFILNKRAL
ncbi:MAG TPA: glycosyltransferase family 4 protein [Halomicronema sp.]